MKYYSFLTFYAYLLGVSMKLTHNWQFQYWHFDKYFISYTGTSVMNLFALWDLHKCKKDKMKVQLFLARVGWFK